MKLIFAICAIFIYSHHVESKTLLSAKAIIDQAMQQQVFRAKGVEMKIAMLLKNEAGEKKIRLLKAYSMRRGAKSRTLVRVLDPADVKGMSFLFREVDGREDDQYMYLPALKATKRIIGANKEARFLGSQFSYADLEWSSIEDANYQFQKDEKLGKELSWVIDAAPKKKSAYHHLRLWIRKKDNVLLRILFFNKDKKESKVLYLKKVEKLLSKKIATRLKMKDLITKETTLLSISDVKERDDFKEEDFSLRALKE